GAAFGESRARGLQQFFGERVAPSGAGEDEGTDHGAELGHAVVIAGGQPSESVQATLAAAEKLGPAGRRWSSPRTTPSSMPCTSPRSGRRPSPWPARSSC